MAQLFNRTILVKGGIGRISGLGDAKGRVAFTEYIQVWHAPVLGTATAVLGTTALPSGSSGSDVTTGLTSPAHPRNVTVIADAAATSVVTVYGTNQFGTAISEDLTLNGTTSVVGSKIFATITKVHMAQRSGPGNITIGLGSKLGLLRVLVSGFAAPTGNVGGTLEGTPPTPDYTNSSVAFNTTLDGSSDFKCKFTSSDLK